MRIDPKRLALPTAPALHRREAAGARFSPGAGGPAKSGGASATAAPATLEALLALQGGAEDPTERRRRSVRRGHDLLDGLDRLKAAILSGRVPTADLKAIAARLSERRDLSGDPGLDDLLSHIELRAQVELAKLAGRQAAPSI